MVIVSAAYLVFLINKQYELEWDHIPAFLCSNRFSKGSPPTNHLNCIFLQSLRFQPGGGMGLRIQEFSSPREETVTPIYAPPL